MGHDSKHSNTVGGSIHLFRTEGIRRAQAHNATFCVLALAYHYKVHIFIYLVANVRRERCPCCQGFEIGHHLFDVIEYCARSLNCPWGWSSVSTP